MYRFPFSCIQRIGLAFMLVASSSALLGEAAADQEFEELVERFAVSGNRDLLFEIAASEHPGAVEVLLQAKGARRPVDLVESLGFEIEADPHDLIKYTQEQLDLGLAIAGHRPSWEAFVNPIMDTDPCSEESASARRDFFRTIHRLKYDRVIRFLASLLYYDDERPEAYEVGGGCSSTSAFAAYALDKMFGEQASTTEASEEEYRRKSVRQMKEWWVENASSYGVEDPEAPFVLNPVPPEESPTSAEAPDTGSTEEAAREDAAEEAETADSWLEENWLLVAGFLVAIAAAGVAVRLRRS